MKFEKGSRVIFKKDGVLHRGKVTQVRDKVRMVVADTNERFTVAVRQLKHAPDKILILEARLDRRLNSNRSYGPMMQQWLSAYGVETMYEKVHSVVDMKNFLRKEGKSIGTRIIHIMGHGLDDTNRRVTVLVLTHEELDLTKQVDVFRGLRGKIIIFSSCELGANLKVLHRIKETSQAKAIIAYRVSVDDYFCNIAETLLYDCLINRCSPKDAVNRTNRAIKVLGVKIDGIITRKPVLICV